MIPLTKAALPRAQELVRPFARSGRWIAGVSASLALVACASFGPGRSAGTAGNAHGDGDRTGYGTSGGVLPPSLAVPPPAAPETPGPLLPEVTRKRLGNGPELHVVPRPGSRIVSVRVVLRVPSTSTSEERVASWAVESMLQGSTQKDKYALETFGSRPQVSASPDGVQIAWSVLPRHVEPALNWLAAKLKSPRLADFDAVAWQLERRESRRMRTDPSYLAGYLDAGSTRDGGTSSLRLQAPHPGLQSPRSFECQRWLLHAVHPARVHVVVLGPVDVSRAEAMVQDAFGDWSAPTKGSPPTPPSRSGERPPGEPLRLAHADGSAWAHLRLSFPGPSRARRERSWVHLQWGLDILRSSEALQRLARELRATAPKIGATLAGDSWQIHVDVSAPGEQALELATRMNEELRRVAKDGFSEQEVARAVHAGRARLRHLMQDQESAATLVADLVERDHDPGTLSEALSPAATRLAQAVEQVNADWQLDDSVERLTVTVVGDAHKLEKALSTWRQVLVFDPKRDLRLLRRIEHDPRAPREISASATEETTGP